MRNYLLVLLALVFCGTLAAQTENPEINRGKFKKEHLFIGSGLNLGIANKSFNAGLNPELGYSITKFLDAGIVFNVNYLSQNPTDFSTIKYQNFSYGSGTFLRIWPVSFFHIQIQPEYNWIQSTQKNMSTGFTQKNNFQAGSLLVGIGYGSHFIGGRYSYITLMMDVLQNPNSPYRDQFNDPIPVFKAGFGMYFRPSKK